MGCHYNCIVINGDSCGTDGKMYLYRYFNQSQSLFSNSKYWLDEKI